MSQKELSELLEVTQGYLSKVENGLLLITERLLTDLMFTLRYPEKFFLDPSPIYPPSMAFYRKYKSLAKRSQDKVCAVTNITRLNIEKMVVSVDLDHKTVPHCDLDEYETPEQAAMAVREFWSLPRGPIQNLTGVLEDAAIAVKMHDVDTRAFSGINLPVAKIHYVILVNSGMPWDRIRWTLAHELGHIVMHSLPTPNMEEEADRFAAEFLMPSQMIRTELSEVSLESLASLKPRWKVAISALLKKALSLNRITERKYRYLWMQMGRLGWRLREPPELTPPAENPCFIRRLIDCHLQVLRYSLGELSELVGMYREEFVEFYSLPRQSSQFKVLKGGA